MNRKILASVAFLGMLFIAPAWSHHPAEGIVSDDIWEMVDTNLDGSAHLDIDFDAVMDSMDVDIDPDGNISLVTSAVVETVKVDEYLYEIELVVVETNRYPAGSTDSDTATILDIRVVNIGCGLSVISLYEPVGSGESQDDMMPRQNKGG